MLDLLEDSKHVGVGFVCVFAELKYCFSINDNLYVCVSVSVCALCPRLILVCQMCCLCVIGSCVLLQSCAVVTCELIGCLIFRKIANQLVLNFIEYLLN